MNRLSRTVLSLCVLAACTAEQAPLKPIDVNQAAVEPGPAPIRRLTQIQYENTIHELLGPEIEVPEKLEPDLVVEGFATIGSGLATVSPLGVERYETAARMIVNQLLKNRVHLERLNPCEPAGSADAGCMARFVADFGKRAWRRPLTEEEEDRLTALGLEAAQLNGDFHEGLGYVIVAMLQSPYFIFRIELGEDGRFNDWELASRLAYFLTNTMPDDELFAAVEAGALTTREGVREQVERLMAKVGAHDGVRNFFAELLGLYALDKLMKDPAAFAAYYPAFGADAREETLRLLTYLVFEKQADFRTFFTTQETFVNAKLAAIYGMEPAGEAAFSKVKLPRTLARRGLLGHASFLALQSHPASTSAVLRGRFVRQTLLCGNIPPPPAELNTGTPEADAAAPTLRDRLALHLANPACASCHSMMDPIGLGFEKFDGIGQSRTEDHGAPIDPSGELDSVHFDDAWGLTGAIAQHPDLGYCLARNLFRYAVGRTEEPGEYLFLEYLSLFFAQTGYNVKSLFVELASSDAFRTAGAKP